MFVLPWHMIRPYGIDVTRFWAGMKLSWIFPYISRVSVLFPWAVVVGFNHLLATSFSQHSHWGLWRLNLTFWTGNSHHIPRKLWALRATSVHGLLVHGDQRRKFNGTFYRASPTSSLHISSLVAVASPVLLFFLQLRFPSHRSFSLSLILFAT